MNKTRYLFLLFFISFTNAIHSQTLKGRVLDQSGEVIPFVHVYLKNNNTHLVTDEKGNFELANLIPHILKDTLLFICSGYEKKEITIVDWDELSTKEIFLIETTSKLQEVLVVGLSRKSKKIDFTKDPSFCMIGLSIGTEVASLIPIKNKYSGIIEDVSVYIHPKGFHECPFKINLYQINPLTEGPGEKIYGSEQLQIGQEESGWQYFSIEHHRIKLPETGVYVGIEAMPSSSCRPRTHEEIMKDIATPTKDKAQYNDSSSLYLLGADYSRPLYRKGIRSWRRYLDFSPLWYLNDPLVSIMAVKLTFKPLHFENIKEKPTKHFELSFTKSSRKSIKKQTGISPKYNPEKYPHSTVKDFFESNLKAVKNNDLLYLFSHLYITIPEEKERGLVDFEMEPDGKIELSEEEKREAVTLFETIIKNINNLQLIQKSSKVYSIVINEQQEIYLLKKKNRWYAYPYSMSKEVNPIKLFGSEKQNEN
jgi:hypothetical protein